MVAEIRRLVASYLENPRGMPKRRSLHCAAVPADEEPSNEPVRAADLQQSERKRVGRYHLLGVIGTGGMGQVHEAYDPELGRRVALKVLWRGSEENSEHSTAGEQRLLLLNEARSLALISDPNVVPIFDAGLNEDGEVYLAMELIVGRTLREVFDEQDLHWRARLALVLAAAKGLAAVHARGLVHRDFKPENVMVGDDGRVQILDFGISSHFRAEYPTNSSSPVERKEEQGDGPAVHGGTPAYMPPEQAQGEELDPRSDSFALACVIYEAICRDKPFVREPLSQRLAQIRGGQIRWPRYVPRWLRSIVARNLAYDRRDRDVPLASFIAAVQEGLDRAEVKRRRLIWRLSASICFCALIFASVSVPRQPIHPDCAVREREIAAIWNQSRQNQLRTSFLATKVPLAGELFSRVATALDAWTVQWLDSAALMCPDTRRDRGLLPLTLAESEQARACFEQARAEIATLLEVWQEPVAARILDSPKALRELSAPVSCVDLQALAQRAPLPTDPTERRRFLQIQKRLAAIRIRIAQHDFSIADVELAAVEAELGDSTNAYLRAQLAVNRAEEAYWQKVSGEAMHQTLQRAALWEIAANATTDRGKTIAKTWFIRVYEENHESESAELFGEHEALLARSGESDILHTQLLRNRGVWAGAQGRFGQAMEHMQGALRLAQKAYGEGAGATANLFDDVGYAAMLIGDSHLAVKYFAQGVEASRLAMGASHPYTIYLEGRQTMAYLSLGEFSQAIALGSSSWRKSHEAGFSIENHVLPVLHVALAQMETGELEAAHHAALALHEHESRVGFRYEPTEVWRESLLATILRRRGEYDSALALANRGVEKVLAESGYHPGVLIRALDEAHQAAIAAGDFKAAKRYFEAMAQWDGKARDFAAETIEVFLGARGRMALVENRPYEAIRFFENRLDTAMKAHRSLFVQSGCSFDLAVALFRAQELEAAKIRANDALSLVRSLGFGVPTLEFEIHELLAQIAVDEGEYRDTIEHVARARMHFDPVEMLEHRLAELTFIEAKAWHHSARSADEHCFVQDLAAKAFELAQRRGASGDPLAAAIQSWRRSNS
jgi:tetratricopeptide (TPR) repeat protein